MNPNRKWHCPDMEKVRSRAKLVSTVLLSLAESGIEILEIDFKPEAPVIEVANCPGTRVLFGAETGRERISVNQVSIKKSAKVCGCKVIWSETI